MNPQDLDRISFITRHFKQLKGLETTVPFGLVWLSLGIGYLLLPRPVPSEGSPGFLLAALACILGAFVFRHRARAYYRAVFGEVELPSLHPFPKDWSAYLLVLAVLLIPALAYAASGWSNGVPGFLLVLFSAEFLCRWVWRGHRLFQAHWLVLGILLLGIRPLISSVPEWEQLAVVALLLSVAYILGGLLDHRLLVREMGRLAAPPHEIEATAATAELETQR